MPRDAMNFMYCIRQTFGPLISVPVALGLRHSVHSPTLPSVTPTWIDIVPTHGLSPYGMYTVVKHLGFREAHCEVLQTSVPRIVGGDLAVGLLRERRRF